MAYCFNETNRPFQEDGDYRTAGSHVRCLPASVQGPTHCGKVTGALGGYSLFGVRCFVKVTEGICFGGCRLALMIRGLVTLIFAVTVRVCHACAALLGLPVYEARCGNSLPVARRGVLRTLVPFQGVDGKPCGCRKVDVRLLEAGVNGKAPNGRDAGQSKTVEDAKSQALNALSKISVNL